MARFKRYRGKDKSISLEEAHRTYRKCLTCGSVKLLVEYFKNRSMSKGYRYNCKDCDMKKSGISKTKRVRARKANLMRTFGITPEEYEQKLKNQNFCCAICKKHIQEFKINFAVDHCHMTGVNRGLLCSSCNNGLGRFRDSIIILQNAITYLLAYNLPKSARQTSIA